MEGDTSFLWMQKLLPVLRIEPDKDVLRGTVAFLATLSLW